MSVSWHKRQEPLKEAANVLKEIEASVKPDDHGVSVESIRQTKTSDVLVELQATKKDRERFGTALSGAFGDNGGIRHLVPRGKLMIYDLVETTEVVDIEEALKAGILSGEGHSRRHIVWECTGEDRSGNCGRCGLKGHKASQGQKKVIPRPLPTAKENLKGFLSDVSHEAQESRYRLPTKMRP